MENPDRAKYRIVVLGNLDPHNWSSSDCFAPVLSPLELRLMISLATKLCIVPKTGDVSQAFCQSVLPENEKYIIKPPSKGCPITPSDVYLLLKIPSTDSNVAPATGMILAPKSSNPLVSAHAPTLHASSPALLLKESLLSISVYS